MFDAEAARVRAALDPLTIEIHHIGSTAVSGIFAKPIIDMLLVVDDLESLDERGDALRLLGYEAKGEFGIVGRRYFRKGLLHGEPTHHLHSFECGSADAFRHLAFRDYLNGHAEAAEAYSALKHDLATRFANDMPSYVAGKTAFIEHHEAQAIAWKRTTTQA